MWLIYYHSFDITTSKTPEEIIETLETITYLSPSSAVKNKHSVSNKIFSGEATLSRFEIFRPYYIRNSFRPIVYGKITKTSVDNSINIRMRMHWFVNVFFSIFVLIFLTFSGVEWYIYLMMIFVPAIIFNIEAIMNKKKLIKIFIDK